MKNTQKSFKAGSKIHLNLPPNMKDPVKESTPSAIRNQAVRVVRYDRVGIFKETRQQRRATERAEAKAQRREDRVEQMKTWIVKRMNEKFQSSQKGKL